MIEQNEGLFSKFIQSFMHWFFRLLYHSLAWAYDSVASAVSFGHWNEWVRGSLKLVQGPRVLELGCGPGHLQSEMAGTGWIVAGLDESRQMLSLARKRLAQKRAPLRLSRGLAQHLPYNSQVFESVVATFPTLYIQQTDTLDEIRRVLKPGGRLVVLWSASITGSSSRERFLSRIYRVTHESPAEDVDLIRFVQPFQQAGFQASLRFMELPGARLMFIIAIKPARG